MEPVNRVYEKAVRWSLKHRAIVAIAALACVIVGVVVVHPTRNRIPAGNGRGRLRARLPHAAGDFARRNQRDPVQKMEQRVAAMPETASFSRRTGAEMGLFATQQNRGDILVKMKPRSERKRSTQEVMDDMRSQIAENIPGVDVEFTQILQDMLGDLEGSPEPVELKILRQRHGHPRAACGRNPAEAAEDPGPRRLRGSAEGQSRDFLSRRSHGGRPRRARHGQRDSAGQRGPAGPDAIAISRGRPHHRHPRALPRRFPLQLHRHSAVPAAHSHKTNRSAFVSRARGAGERRSQLCSAKISA